MRIVESGALEGQRVELLDGIITEMSPQSPEHAAIIQRLSAYLAGAAAQGLLRVQLPLAVSDDSLPEPDLAVVDTQASRTRHPSTAALVIEVAVTSHELDRSVKAGLYATAEVATLWIVDVPAGAIEVRTEPRTGSYRRVSVYQAGDVVPAPLADVAALPVADLLGG